MLAFISFFFFSKLWMLGFFIFFLFKFIIPNHGKGCCHKNDNKDKQQDDKDDQNPPYKEKDLVPDGQSGF